MSKALTTPERVLHLNDDLDVGGVERVVVNLANELSQRSLTVGVLAAGGGSLWDELQPNVIRHEVEARTGFLSSMRYTRAIREVVRTEGWQVVHAHQRGLSLIARLATAGLGVPVVEHVHSMFRPTGIKKLFSFRGNHIIACGSAGGRMIVDEFGRPRRRVTVVTNAVADPGIEDSSPLVGRQRAPHLVAVGRLSDEKDPIRFVEIVRQVQERIPSCTARWVGDGPLRSDVELHLKRHSVRNFEMEGVSRNVGHYIKVSDLLLMTSKHEGLPLVVLESMALGRPVVVPDVGSLRDVVRDGHNGVIFDPREPTSKTAERISELLSSEEHLRMRQAARTTFESIGSIAAMANAVLCFASLASSWRPLS